MRVKSPGIWKKEISVEDRMEQGESLNLRRKNGRPPGSHVQALIAHSVDPTRRATAYQYGNLPYTDSMKQEQPTTARLEARLSQDVLARLKRAAEIQGRTLTDFVVAAADEAARRAIEQTEVIRLAREGQEQFAALLLNPPKATSSLVRAFKRRRSMIVE